MRHEYRVECERCGITGASYIEDLNGSFCGACNRQIKATDEHGEDDCDCIDCQENGIPCRMDCDDEDTMCSGCRHRQYMNREEDSRAHYGS